MKIVRSHYYRVPDTIVVVCAVVTDGDLVFTGDAKHEDEMIARDLARARATDRAYGRAMLQPWLEGL